MNAEHEYVHRLFRPMTEPEPLPDPEPEPGRYAVDPLNPTDAELSAAIQRGLADGTLIDAADWMNREAQAEAELELELEL